MMLTRLTTEQFHRGLKVCNACSVNGWPAIVEWAKEVPRMKSSKPYAVLRWAEWDDKGSSATPMVCELRKDNVASIDMRSAVAVEVTFRTKEPSIIIGLMTFAHVLRLAPPMRWCGAWERQTIGEFEAETFHDTFQGIN